MRLCQKLQNHHLSQCKVARAFYYKESTCKQRKNNTSQCSDSIIPLVPVPLPNNHNLLFHSTTQANLILYMHIIDHKTSKVLVRNTSNHPLYISRRHKLGHVVDIAYDNCFLADTQVIFNLAAFPPAALPFLDLGAGSTLAPRNTLIETQLNNGVRVYGDSAAVKEISELVAKSSSI